FLRGSGVAFLGVARECGRRDRETIGCIRAYPPVGATLTAFLQSLSGANEPPAMFTAGPV
ncbi:MAG TPA: hypothetical protein VKB01_10275, partial [Thermomicrobiales bacterium]|nr:hypothetical protein [Thermomicrobiales bacterium]